MGIGWPPPALAIELACAAEPPAAEEPAAEAEEEIEFFLLLLPMPGSRNEFGMRKRLASWRASLSTSVSLADTCSDSFLLMALLAVRLSRRALLLYLVEVAVLVRLPGLLYLSPLLILFPGYSSHCTKK